MKRRSFKFFSLFETFSKDVDDKNGFERYLVIYL